MQEKINKLAEEAKYFAYRMRDVRFAGLVLFGILVLLISWSGVKSIQTNYTLQKQIATLQQQVQVQQLENNNLKLQNEYYNTNEYLELSARQNFGLAAPGETELIVPKSVALSHVAQLPSRPSPASQPSAKKPFYQKNFEDWVNFFLHRQSTE